MSVKNQIIEALIKKWKSIMSPMRTDGNDLYIDKSIDDDF